MFEEHRSLELCKCQRSSLKQILESVNIKSRANILTRVQSKAYTEPSSFSSLFNLPYSKDIHYFSQARHIAHSTTQCRNLYLYYEKLKDISLCLKSIGLLSFVNAREVLLNKY